LDAYGTSITMLENNDLKTQQPFKSLSKSTYYICQLQTNKVLSKFFILTLDDAEEPNKY
jgi:hypothetical protein